MEIEEQLQLTPRILKDERLTPADKLVLARMLMKDGTAETIADTASYLGVSYKTVWNSKVRLEKYRLIATSADKGRGKAYRVIQELN